MSPKAVQQVTQEGIPQMNVEFTGRQYEITPAERKQVEHGLLKLQKILGNTFDTHVILATVKKRHIAEITVNVRNNSLVGIAEAAEMSQAIGEAMDKIDRQAVKYKTRYRAKKRIARKARATTKWNGASINSILPSFLRCSTFTLPL